jgi:hypothetical protein
MEIRLAVSRSCTKNLDGVSSALSPLHKSPLKLPGNQPNSTKTSVVESNSVTADPYVTIGRSRAMHRKAKLIEENAHQVQPLLTIRAHISVRTATTPRIKCVLPTKSFAVAKARQQTKMMPRTQRAKRDLWKRL